MKLLTRGFTKKEKILLVVLALILVGLCYYRFVLKYSYDAINQAKQEQAEQETEITILEAQAAQLEGMAEDLEATKSSGDTSYMPSYNSKKEELQFLNSILQKSNAYNISFNDVTRYGNLIRRSFSLEFTAKNYQAASALIEQLNNSEDRCLIEDVEITGKKNSGTAQPITDNTVICSLTATFYETMYDGTADAGLPEDQKAAEAAKASADEDE